MSRISKASRFREGHLLDLRRQLGTLPPRSAERRRLIQEAAVFYGVSEPTLYRLLRQRRHPRSLGRADRGSPRVLPKADLERYLELIAALKVRTSNGKGRHLSTGEAIRVLEHYGVDTPEGHIQAPKGLLKTPTVNAYLHAWGLDWRTLRREPPAVRFQAQYSNELWQFDISPSDLKQLKAPAWIDARKGQPTLMLLSVVDNRSGVAYQEYHCAYGEAAEVALQFLFNAMALKADARFPFGGRPAALYTDNGPVTRSHVFCQVMDYLGIAVQTHLPRGHDGRRTTASAKGKVERPFRTVKEAYVRRESCPSNCWLDIYPDQPGIPLPVAYRHMWGWQRPGMNLSGQGTHSQATGSTEPREGSREHCERHAVVGLG